MSSFSAKRKLIERYFPHKPLAPNEFLHGTNSADAARIHADGFKLADPNIRYKTSSSYKRRTDGDNTPGDGLTRKGRNRSTGNNGAGVYLTRDRDLANEYARGKRNGEPQVVRVQIPHDAKFIDQHDRRLYAEMLHRQQRRAMGGKSRAFIREMPTARRMGYDGVSSFTPHRSHYVFGDPRKVKPVKDAREAHVAHIATDAAVASTVVGGSAYGAHKVKKFDTPAWTREEGKNPNGGLNAKGRASAKAEGHNLKPPVKAGNNPRRASFLARMGNMPGPEHKPNGEPTRLLLSLNAWGASSKADAKRKAAAMSVHKSDQELKSKVLRDGRKIAYLSTIPIAGRAIGTARAAQQAPAGLRARSAASQNLGTTLGTLPLAGAAYGARHYIAKHPNKIANLKNKHLLAIGGGAIAASYGSAVAGGMVGQTLHRKKHMDEYLKHYKKQGINKSFGDDTLAEQSRFGGAGSVGYAYDEVSKAKKRKPSVNPQQRVFRDLERMEAEHAAATANGHSTVKPLVRPTHGVVVASPSVEGTATRNVRFTPRRIGAAAFGVGAIGAVAYGAHKYNQNRLSTVNKGVRLDRFAETKLGQRYLENPVHYVPKKPKLDAENIPYMSVKYGATKKLKRDAAIAGTSLVGTGGVYGAHRMSQGGVNKASLGGSRVLRGAADAVRGARSGARGGRSSAEILGSIQASAAKDAKRAEAFGPRTSTPLKDVAPARPRTKLAVPGGQGGTFAVDRKAMADEAGMAYHRQAVKGKELAIRPKAGGLVPTGGRATATNVRAGSNAVPAPSKPGSSIVPTNNGVYSIKGVHVGQNTNKPLKSVKPKPNLGENRDYRALAGASIVGGGYLGSQIYKAYDEYGNQSGFRAPKASTTGLVAGIGTTAYGLKTLGNSGKLPTTAPVAADAKNATATAAKKLANQANKNVASSQASYQAARSKPFGFFRAGNERKMLQHHESLANNATNAANKAKIDAKEARDALHNVPHMQVSGRNLGAGLALGGAALAVGSLKAKRNGS